MSLSLIEQHLLSPAELAARLNIGRSTVYDLIVRGELPAVRVGRQWRTTPEQLEAYLSRQDTNHS